MLMPLQAAARFSLAWIMFVLAAVCFFLAGADIHIVIDGHAMQFHWFGVMFLILGLWVVG